MFELKRCFVIDVASMAMVMLHSPFPRSSGVLGVLQRPCTWAEELF
jgi:hypothetical protein